jgi:hypothetical protein
MHVPGRMKIGEWEMCGGAVARLGQNINDYNEGVFQNGVCWKGRKPNKCTLRATFLTEFACQGCIGSPFSFQMQRFQSRAHLIASV